MIRVDLQVAPETAMRNLELNLGMACNNRCVFCLSGAVVSSERRWLLLENARRELKDFYDMGCRSLGFLGGEPTAYPHILECVRYARSLGYQRIALCSNGTKFSDPSFVQALVAAGVTRFGVSLHSHEAEIEDRLTGLPGNFERKLKGLRHLRRLRERGLVPDNVSLNPVLNSKTLHKMEAYIEFVRKEDFDDIRFNFIWPQARVERDRDMVPSYREAMPEVLRVMLINEVRWRMHITFGAVPRCMLSLGGRPLSAELSSRLGTKYLSECDDLLTEVSSQGHPVTTGRIDGYDGRPAFIDPQSRDRFSWRERKRSMLKIRGPNCGRCRHFPDCDGVWKSYAELYGLDELTPVERS